MLRTGSGRRICVNAVCLTLAVVLLCGCTSGAESAGNAPNGTAQANLPVFVIGIDSTYEPYTYVDENGNYAGLDIELATEACARMGRTPQFEAIKWDDKNNLLADGSIDCVWSCFSMTGREEDYNWVGPYMYSRQVIAVRDDSDITKLSQLDDKTIAVMSSTKPESILLEKSSDTIPDVKNVYCMENMDIVFSALESGYVDAAAGHETTMRQYIDTMPGHYRLLDEELQAVEVGVAFDKNNTDDVISELKGALDDMGHDGTLARILEEYEISADGVASDSEEVADSED